MRSACYRMDITPEIGTPIGGNVREDNRSRGIHDRLYANYLYLSDGEQQILFVGLDLIGVFGSFVQTLKVGIQQHTDIQPHQIVLFATHTHSGPDVMEAFKEGYDPYVSRYIETLQEKLIQGAIACCSEIWDAQLAVGKGVEDSLSFNRRIFMKDGTLRMNWEGLDPEQIDRTAGPIDPEVVVLSVQDPRARIRCLLINFTLHPAILVGKDWLISRDYIDSLTRTLQQEYGDDLIVLFANGAEGNINHINAMDLEQTRGFEETDRIGSKLAADVSEILKSLEYKQKVKVNAMSETISLPRRIITEEQMKQALQLLESVNWKIPSLLDGVPDEVYAKEILALGKSKEPFVETELQVLQVGELAFVSLPGEFFVEFGLSIKSHSPFLHTAILGMANDYIGYVPTERAFEEGGYEVKTARTSQLVPKAGVLVEEKVQEMLVQLKGGGRP